MQALEALIGSMINSAPLWWVVAMVIIAFGMYLYYERFAPLTRDVDKLKDDVVGLKDDVAALKQDVGTLDAKVNTLDVKMEALTGRVDRMGDVLEEIAKWIIKEDKTILDDMKLKFSPARLTPLGEEVYRLCKAKEVMEANIDKYLADLEAYAPQTAYDVEDRAMDVLRKRSSEIEFKPIKDFLYLAPDPYPVRVPETGEETTVRLDIFKVINIMSTPLRDAYLERHPELIPIIEE